MQHDPTKTSDSTEVITLSNVETIGTVNIVAIGRNLWKVTTAFAIKDSTKEAIPLKLKEIKQEISRHFQHPESLLRYRQLRKKVIQKDGSVQIEIEIERLAIPSGAPHIILEPMLSDCGEEFRNMICRVDLFPLDDRENQIEVDTVRERLAKTGIEERFVRWNVLEETIQNILDRLIPMHNVEIARGELPSKGEDAVIDLKFPLRARNGLTNEYMRARKVKRGDVLCRKTPPTLGNKPGSTLQGQILPPRMGWDVKLVAARGTRCNPAGTEVLADVDGLVIANRREKSIEVPYGRKIIPVEISIHVEPLTVLSGKRREILTTDSPIEVAGSLWSNSKLISRSLIHVQGDVHRGSMIQASGDITIAGGVTEGTLTSDGCITADGGVTESKITARGCVRLGGLISGSDVRGCDLDLGAVQGSDIQAQRRVTVEIIGAADDGRLSQINIGKNKYLREKIRQDANFNKSARQNLKRLCKLFDIESDHKLEPSEQARVLMRLLNKRKRQSNTPYTSREVEALKQLLGSVRTLESLITEKSAEIAHLENQLTEEDDTKKLLVVRERVTARTIVVMGDYHTEIEPTDSGIFVTTDDQGISVESLPDSLDAIEALITTFEQEEPTVPGFDQSDQPTPTN